MTKPTPSMPKGIRKEKNRHGKTVYYYRPDQDGPRTRLNGVPFTEEFITSYNLAKNSQKQPSRPKGAEAGTLRWLIEAYKASPEWGALNPSTKRAKDLILSKISASSGVFKISQIDPRSIEMGRDDRAATPEAANSRIKVLRTLFSWGMQSHHTRNHVKSNPAASVKMLSSKGDGFHSWTNAELERFKACWPLGTRERLAFALLYLTGVRRSDVVRLGPEHINDGVLEINPLKTPNVTVTITVRAQLKEALEFPLDAQPKAGRTFIRCEDGKPMRPESFTNWFRRACKKAGVPGSAHGLRKAAACYAAEAGATESQLMALFGWVDGRQAQHYAKAANRKEQGRKASKMLDNRDQESLTS